jgi:ribosomal protein S18 acetylase RimI-like enzyme
MYLQKLDISDLYCLQEIAKQTFLETFSEGNSNEEMQLYLRDSFSLKKLFEALSNPLSQFYFVAEHGHRLGYLKVNMGNAQSETMGDKAMELERIYILKAYYGKGYGQLLLDKAIELAKRFGVQYVWLGVWEHNHRAVAFYKKNNFEVFGDHIFQFGSEAQTDWLMRKYI